MCGFTPVKTSDAHEKMRGWMGRTNRPLTLALIPTPTETRPESLKRGSAEVCANVIADLLIYLIYEYHIVSLCGWPMKNAGIQVLF